MSTISQGYIKSNGGSSGIAIRKTEVPLGIIDGINDLFLLTSDPVDNSLKVIVNGQEQTKGVNYQLSRANVPKSEIPVGTINGVNTVFTLSSSPVYGYLNVFIDGVRMNPGSETISGKTITLAISPTSTIVVDYVADGTSIVFYSGSIPLPEQFLWTTYRRLITDIIGGYIPIDENPTEITTGLVYSLNYTPESGSLILLANGKAMSEGDEFTMVDNIITSTISLTGMQIIAHYQIKDYTSRLHIKFGEIPSGLVNGINKTFILSKAPINKSEELMVNGKYLRGNEIDYIISGLIITLNNAPVIGQKILCPYYEYL